MVILVADRPTLQGQLLLLGGRPDACPSCNNRDSQANFIRAQLRQPINGPFADERTPVLQELHQRLPHELSVLCSSQGFGSKREFHIVQEPLSCQQPDQSHARAPAKATNSSSQIAENSWGKTAGTT